MPVDITMFALASNLKPANVGATDLPQAEVFPAPISRSSGAWRPLYRRATDGTLARLHSVNGAWINADVGDGYPESARAYGLTAHADGNDYAAPCRPRESHACVGDERRASVHGHATAPHGYAHASAFLSCAAKYRYP